MKNRKTVQSLTLPSNLLLEPQSNLDTDGFVKQDDFVTKVDPAKIAVKILKYEKKFIGQSYHVVETTVDENTFEMVAETNINYHQFQAFH